MSIPIRDIVKTVWKRIIKRSTFLCFGYTFFEKKLMNIPDDVIQYIFRRLLKISR